jgi:lambda repressor-like predicted transcriptional regulator
MATRSKPNWKVLDILLPMLEKEGWSHAQIAEDWGISLARLLGHLTQEASMPLREIDWQRFDELKAQGLSMQRISEAMTIPKRTLEDRLRQRRKESQGTPEGHHNTPSVHQSVPEQLDISEPVHPGTPENIESPEHPGTLEGHQEVIEDVSESVPDVPHISTEPTPEHPSTPIVHPEMSPPHSSMAHSGVPARQDRHISTPLVHPGTPTEEDWMLWTAVKGRWGEIEKMLADWQSRHALLSTPSGTPRHTMKKTYVVDSVYVELIDQYARSQGVEIKDVVNLAFHEFFERREYLPKDAKDAR